MNQVLEGLATPIELSQPLETHLEFLSSFKMVHWGSIPMDALMRRYWPSSKIVSNASKKDRMRVVKTH